jgi:hypothetical protein
MGSCCTKDEFKPNNGELPQRKRSVKIIGEIDKEEFEDKDCSFSSDG